MDQWNRLCITITCCNNDVVVAEEGDSSNERRCCSMLCYNSPFFCLVFARCLCLPPPPPPPPVPTLFDRFVDESHNSCVIHDEFLTIVLRWFGFVRRWSNPRTDGRMDGQWGRWIPPPPPIPTDDDGCTCGKLIQHPFSPHRHFSSSSSSSLPLPCVYAYTYTHSLHDMYFFDRGSFRGSHSRVLSLFHTHFQPPLSPPLSSNLPFPPPSLFQMDTKWQWEEVFP